MQEEQGRQPSPKPEQRQQDKRLLGLGKRTSGSPQEKKRNWKGLHLGERDESNGQSVLGIGLGGRCEADKDAQTFGARLTESELSPEIARMPANEHVCRRITLKHRCVSWPTPKVARHGNWFLYENARRIL